MGCGITGSSRDARRALCGIGVETRVTCVLRGCARSARYSPIDAWTERRVLYGRRVLVGDLYEREKRGNLYGGKCLVALFTMTG